MVMHEQELLARLPGQRVLVAQTDDGIRADWTRLPLGERRLAVVLRALAAWAGSDTIAVGTRS
ncbi:hypothetical protein GCM10018785_25790 [Streptomyces longispororuber]|uniref:Uncharacterized protein n=1 Tax=Streptomyces longispororuber TaxID=68230 RepID=A0A918ZJQ8_9ACTN|nr:hypothetical protein [Streptomyces longispororuber]GHE55230.1 hypothetical protein GCM10018785_25790 [Streptomyces longispororuber]